MSAAVQGLELTNANTPPVRNLNLVFDTEANGFYDNGTKMWLFCAKDMFTGQRWEWGGPEGLEPHKKEIQALLMRAKLLACHNLIKHDLPQMYKLGIAAPKHWEGAKIVDTFTISSLLNPDRPRVSGAKGPHGLDAWGIRSGMLKPEQEQWEVWEEAMRVRCSRDVEINEWAFRFLQDESRQDDWAWKTSIGMEHQAAFIIAEQERNGWHFFKEKARGFIEYLDSELNRIDALVVPMMPPKMMVHTPIRKLYKANGQYTAQVCKWFGFEPDDAKLSNPPISVNSELSEEFLKEHGCMSRISWEIPNPNSDIQMKEFLLTQGWLPDEYTPKGSPRLTEDSLDSVSGEAGRLLARRKVMQARRTQLESIKDPNKKGWMSMIRDDGRIEAVCNPCGCNTGRARHKQIVNVPRTTTEFGREMRSVFGAPEGYFMLGYDASGLELRCLAHYMEDAEYIEQVLHGDIHTVNQLAAGLPDREMAKTFIYALIYGAGDLKIGRIVGGNSTTGKELRYKFFRAIPALDALLTRTKTIAKRGFLRGIDGRKLMVRSDHSSLNTLLQAAGAIVMKYAYISLDQWLTTEGYKNDSRSLSDIYAPTPRVMKVGDIHDEGQLQVNKDVVTDMQEFTGSAKEAKLWVPDDRIWSAEVRVGGNDGEGTFRKYYARPGELAVYAIRQAGTTLQFNCPLDADYRIGQNWAQTH